MQVQRKDENVRKLNVCATSAPTEKYTQVFQNKQGCKVVPSAIEVFVGGESVEALKVLCDESEECIGFLGRNRGENCWEGRASASPKQAAEAYLSTSLRRFWTPRILLDPKLKRVVIAETKAYELHKCTAPKQQRDAYDE